MRWVFAAGAVICAVILFLPVGGNSTWSSAGICSSALGQFAQHSSNSAQSNCATDQIGTFVLGVLIVAFIALAVVFQRKHLWHRELDEAYDEAYEEAVAAREKTGNPE
jgi:hypothetical protein